MLSRRDLQAFFRGQAIRKGDAWWRFLSICGAVVSQYYYNPDFTRWVLQFEFPLRKKVAIIGGNYAGIELGETLSGRGKEVTILEESKRAGVDIGIVHRWVVMDKLKKAGAKIPTGPRPVGTPYDVAGSLLARRHHGEGRREAFYQ